MMRVCLCLVGALAVCCLVLAGVFGSLPPVALHYLFAVSVTVAIVCLAVLVGVLGAKVLRWVLFLDDPAPGQSVPGRGA